MKFSADPVDSPWRIRACEPGRIRIGETWYEEALLLVPGRGVEPWPVKRLEAISSAELERLAGLEPEVLLFGTGPRQALPHPALLAPLLARRIGCEVMDTAAACRTYNILLSEGRRVVAALVP